MRNLNENKNYKTVISIEEYLEKREQIKKQRFGRQNTFGWEYLNYPNAFRQSRSSLL